MVSRTAGGMTPTVRRARIQKTATTGVTSSRASGATTSRSNSKVNSGTIHHSSMVSNETNRNHSSKANGKMRQLDA